MDRRRGFQRKVASTPYRFVTKFGPASLWPLAYGEPYVEIRGFRQIFVGA